MKENTDSQKDIHVHTFVTNKIKLRLEKTYCCLFTNVYCEFVLISFFKIENTKTYPTHKQYVSQWTEHDKRTNTKREGIELLLTVETRVGVPKD